MGVGLVEEGWSKRFFYYESKLKIKKNIVLGGLREEVAGELEWRGN